MMNMKFATKALATLTLGMFTLTACTDYVQEFKDDENNKQYASANGSGDDDSGNDSGDDENTFDIPNYMDLWNEPNYVIWQALEGNSDDEPSANTTVRSGREIYVVGKSCASATFKYASKQDGESGELSVSFVDNQLFPIGSLLDLGEVIQYYGGIGGSISDEGCESEDMEDGLLTLIFPYDSTDLEDHIGYFDKYLYNVIMSAPSDVDFDVELAKVDFDKEDDEVTIETVLHESNWGGSGEVLFESAPVWMNDEDADYDISRANWDHVSQYNAVVIKFRAPGDFVVAGIGLSID